MARKPAFPAATIASALALLSCVTIALAAQPNPATEVQPVAPPAHFPWRRNEMTAPADMVLPNLLPTYPVPGYALVTGGNPAGDTPWQVELYSTYEFGETDFMEDEALPLNSPIRYFLREMPPWERAHRCGGAYIGDMWVLTAAHCVANVPADKFFTIRRIRAGTRNLAAGGATFRIERVVIHQHYMGPSMSKLNDIALIRIAADASTDAEAATFMKAIRIPGDRPGDRPLTDLETVTVTGWGYTEPRLPFQSKRKPDGTIMHLSSALMSVDLTQFPRSSCAAIPAYRNLIAVSMICAGSTDPARDACQGDSGGPLTRKETPTETVLVGLVSVGIGCAYASTPGIYTSVPFFRTWINNAKLQSLPGQIMRL
jgi:hypothetical protein